MAPHSSTLDWKIPWTEEPGRLQSMGSPRVRHDWATSLSLFTFMHWRRKWQPTPVFLPEESHGQRSLVGHSPWGHKSVRHNLVTKQQAAIRFCACHFAICLCLSLSYTRRYFSKLFHILLENQIKSNHICIVQIHLKNSISFTSC